MKRMPLKRLLVLLSLLAMNKTWAQNSSDVIDYINKYKELAIREEQRSGVPASITLAQGIHETEAGKSDLVLKSNNHFGIKCRAEWTGDKVYHDDDAKGECFRSYPTAAESYADHSDFLRKGPRYAFLFDIDPTDYNQWAWGLKKAGYATNSKYPQIIIKYIEDYNLQQYTLIAMGKMSPKDEVLAKGGKPLGDLSISNGVAIREINVAPAKPAVQYPTGEFTINRTRVIYVKSGASLLGIAKEFDISLKHLLDFNELNENDDILKQDQLVYLQRKRKVGANEFHEVQPGENLYDICQAEGIRLESLLERNRLEGWQMPAVGEKLYLQDKASERPKLASEVVNTAKQSVAQTTTTAAATITAAPPTDQLTPANSSAVAASMHVVKDKETLYSIAKKYNITVDQLREWNKLTGYDLKIGQELVIYKN